MRGKSLLLSRSGRCAWARATTITSTRSQRLRPARSQAALVPPVTSSTRSWAVICRLAHHRTALAATRLRARRRRERRRNGQCRRPHRAARSRNGCERGRHGRAVVPDPVCVQLLETHRGQLRLFKTGQRPELTLFDPKPGSDATPVRVRQSAATAISMRSFWACATASKKNSRPPAGAVKLLGRPCGARFCSGGSTRRRIA